ncbi:hypothetical protein EG327_000172 [Venturia inaequalis]|uniref:Uncharacterized protein n=1 Tax=Venturia inaequalis TaxID=5025 RepID=A0A8H3ZCK7_VENIN|nr:hypothetical protein EG327_000172 [Venturia inaequalis]
MELMIDLGRYKSISDLVYNPGHPLVSENQRVRGMTIVIFCGFSRFVLEQGVYIDRPNNIKITESEWQEFALDWGLVAIAEHIEYAQSLNGRSAKASAITFRLEYLARMQSRFMSDAAYCLFDDPNSERTINNCAARIDDFWQLAGQGPDKAFSSSLPMDAVNRALDSLLIHELSHAYYCGKTIDAEQKGLYGASGWKNACIMKNQGNADSIALFAAAVKLIKIGYVVNPDGSFYKA